MQRVLFYAVWVSVVITQFSLAAEPNQPMRRVLTLHPTPTYGPPIEFNYSFGSAPAPFEKEPTLEGKEVARGWIPTSPPTPLIRDVTAGQIHLKTDHDQDFTRGSLATYPSQCKDGKHYLFAGVKVFSEQGSLMVPYTIDLRVYRRGFHGGLYVRSAWATRFELDGREWIFTLIDNLDGRIDGNDRLMLAEAQATGAARVGHTSAAPETLFLDGHAFRMEYAYKQIETAVVLEAVLTEIQLPMGLLEIRADGCRSVALRDGGQIIVLERPDGLLTIPAGRYRVDHCSLEIEPNEYQPPQFVGDERELPVEPGQTASLRLGLPLNNTFIVTRDRNLLAFKYRLVGAGGEFYDHPSLASQPAFRVYKGPVRIGSGSFGFG
ncbi:MAG: hypothetical protein ABFD90_09825 [Phycisphaerales bacterium]